MFINKRQIIRAAKLRGWMLHPTALEGIEHLLTENSTEDELSFILDLVSTKMKSAGTVTADIWSEIVAELNDESDIRLEQPVQSGNNNPFADLEVVSAFRTPRLLYRPTRKQFQVEESRWPLFGEAEDKVSVYGIKETQSCILFLLHFSAFFDSSSRRTCWNEDTTLRTNESFVMSSFVPLIY